MPLEDGNLQGEPSAPFLQTKWLVPAALTLTALICGSWTIIAHAALSRHGVSPMILAFYRVLGGTTLMCVAHKIVEGKAVQHVNSKSVNDFKKGRTPFVDVLIFALLGLLQAFNIAGNILSLKWLPPLTVSVFQPLLPIVSGLAAVLTGVEDFNFLKFCGCTCATAGAIVVVVFSPHNNHGHGGAAHEISMIKGVPCVLLNVVGAALYNVVQKGVLRTYPPIYAAAAAFSAATGIIFIAAVTSDGVKAEAWRLGGSGEAVGALFFAIFFTTALNYMIFAWANKESSPTTVTSFLTLQPVFAAIFAWILLGEGIRAEQAIGGAAIIVGLGCFLRSQPVRENTMDEAQQLLPAK